MLDSEDVTTIRRAIESRLLSVRTSVGGEVRSFDANTMTATIRPVVRFQVADEDAPITVDQISDLEEVPVMFPHYGPFILYHPLSVGDVGRLEWSEEDDSEIYQDDGAPIPSDPGILARHRAGVVFRPEGFRGEGALGEESSAHGFIGFPGGIGIQFRDGELRLGGSGATDPVVRLSDLQTVIDALNTHTHSGVTSGGSATGAPVVLLSDATGSEEVKST